jgi:hypothetical protein
MVRKRANYLRISAGITYSDSDTGGGWRARNLLAARTRAPTEATDATTAANATAA